MRPNRLNRLLSIEAGSGSSGEKESPDSGWYFKNRDYMLKKSNDE